MTPATASDVISLGDAAALERLAVDSRLWLRLLDGEEELAQEVGMLDGGAHILFAVEKVRYPAGDR